MTVAAIAALLVLAFAVLWLVLELYEPDRPIGDALQRATDHEHHGPGLLAAVALALVLEVIAALQVIAAIRAAT